MPQGWGGALGGLAATSGLLPAQFKEAILHGGAKEFSHFRIKTLAGPLAFHWEGFWSLS